MKENPFNKQRFSLILKLAMPIMAGMGSQTILNLVDTAMVGRVGTVAQGAVGLASMALWVTTSLMQGISPAVQAITARRLGEKDEAGLHDAIVNAFFLILIIGLPYSYLLLSFAPDLFNWLSNDPEVRQVGLSYINIRLYTVILIGLNFSFRGFFNGRHLSKLYMQTLLMMHPVNAILNYILIFGKWGFPAMGADGAALGTAIATGLGTCNYLRLMFLHRNQYLHFSPLAVNLRVIRGLLKLAAPSCIQGLTMAAGFLAFFRIADMISKEALAATNVLINLALMCILFSMGLGIALLSLVGKSLGEKEPEEAVRWLRSTMALAATAMSILGLTLAVAPRFWLSIFIVEAPTLDIAVVPLIIFGISQIYDAATIVMMHAHLGGGATKAVAVISIVSQWCIFLPSCFIWVHYFNGQLVHIWICMGVYRFIQFLWFLLSIRSGIWLRITV